MQNVKLFLVVFFSFGGIASADTYQVGSVLSQMKLDRKVYLTRVQSLKVSGFTAEVLRSAMIEQVLCRIQTPIVSEACLKLRGHSSLDGQGAHDLSTFNLDGENLRVVISGLVGMIQAVQPSLREENLLQAQDILVSSGKAMLQLSNPEIAAQMVSAALEKNSSLSLEFSRNQDLQIYFPLLTEIRAWLQAAPVGLPERTVAARQTLKSNEVTCILTTDGFAQCRLNLDGREVELAKEWRERKFSTLIRSGFLSHLCAQDENGGVLCQDGVFHGKPWSPSGCSGNQIDLKGLGERLIYTGSFAHGQWEIEQYKTHHRTEKSEWVAKVYCAGVQEDRLYVLYKDREFSHLSPHRVPADRSTDSGPLSLQENASNLSYFLNRYISVDRDGFFDAGNEFEWVKTPLFDGIPKAKIQSLKISENHLCLLFEGPVWNCISVWDRKGAGVTWAESSYSLPAGEFSLSGPGVATEDQIFVSGYGPSGSRQTLKIPRPAGSHDFYFFRTRGKFSLSSFEDVVCYLVKGEMQCRYFSGENFAYPDQDKMKGLKRLFYFPKNSYGRQLCGVTDTTWICPGRQQVIQVPPKFRRPLEKMATYPSGVCLLEKGDQVSCLSRNGSVVKVDFNLAPGDHVRRFLTGTDLCIETDREVLCEGYEATFSLEKVRDIVRGGTR